jgi:hypothetical protein
MQSLLEMLLIMKVENSLKKVIIRGRKKGLRRKALLAA